MTNNLLQSKTLLASGNSNIQRSQAIIFNNYWPKDSPEYFSTEGWEHEKKMAYEKLKKQIQAKR